MLLEAAVTSLLRVQMQIYGWTRWRPLIRYARDPRRAQQQVLSRILRANRDTYFGRKHGFAAITGYDEFKAAIPIQTYETLRPFADEQARTGAPALTSEPPVLYALTSGTTGQPKRIPILREALKLHKWTTAAQTCAQYRVDPGAFHGSILGIVGAAVEGKLESGVPYGSASGHGYRNMPALAKTKYVLPAEVFEIEDYELKYTVILRLALNVRNIRCMFAANPSTFLKLLSLLRQNRAALLEDVTQGSFRRNNELPSHIRSAIASYLPCSPARSSELRQLLAAPEPGFSDLWPELRLVVTWTGGSCGIALSSLKTHLAKDVRVCEMGYLSSEFRGTIIVDGKRNLGFPTIHENFFEFVERDSWDAGRGVFCTIDRLESGKQYYVIVTTPSGLYRYFMNDIVTVTGMFEATPTIQFLQKGRGVTSITGEKLYESHVIQAVRAAEAKSGCTSSFFVMLAAPLRAVYTLVYECSPQCEPLMEDLAERVDKCLEELNVEYAQKRASGRLAPLEVLPVAVGTGEAYKQYCIGRGQREGQFKTLALQYVEECCFRFEEHRIQPERATVNLP
jgi:hypothetical protein